MLLCPNKGFLEQHSSATVREKDKIRVQNDDFAGNRKSQDDFNAWIFLKNPFSLKSWISSKMQYTL